MNNLPTIFRDCCSSGVVRFDMSKPFGIGEFTYATDGRICVRIPGVGDTIFNAPTADSLPWSRELYVDEAQGLETWDELACSTLCPYCYGLGHFVNDECETCVDGVEFDGPCPECAGKQVIVALEDKGRRCVSCYGSGRAFGDAFSIRVGDGHFGANYMALLSRHNVNEFYHWKGPQGPQARPLYFRGPGFDGLLMPRSGGIVIGEAL